MKLKYLLIAIILIIFVASGFVYGEHDKDDKFKNDKPHHSKKPKPNRTPIPKQTCAPLVCPPGQGSLQLGIGSCDYICSSDACKTITCASNRMCDVKESPEGCCPCRI